MGTRINIVIGDRENVGVILYSNSSHPEVDAEKILREVVASSSGITEMTARLLAVTYPSSAGNNRAGDRVFSIDTEPGNHEKVLYITNGKVTEGDNADFQVKVVKAHHINLPGNVLPPQHIDDLAAGKVMEWKLGVCTMPKCYRDEHGDCWSVSTTCGHPGSRDFLPSTDPAADYLVLEKVRSTWDRHALGFFALFLTELWSTRMDVPPVQGHGATYNTGDYAKAALMALGLYHKNKEGI